MRALTVRWGDRVVGALTIDDHGDIRFAYDFQWLNDPVAPAISISLPKRADPFSRRECRPFFDGLLPEEGQREALAAALKVSKGNEFALVAPEKRISNWNRGIPRWAEISETAGNRPVTC